MKKIIIPFTLAAFAFVSMWPAYLLAQSKEVKEYSVQNITIVNGDSVHITVINGDTVAHDHYMLNDVDEDVRVKKGQKSVVVDFANMDEFDFDVEIDIDSIVNAVLEDFDLEDIDIEMEAVKTRKGKKMISKVHVKSNDENGNVEETHDVVIKSIVCKEDGKGKSKKVVIINSDGENTTITQTEDGNTTAYKSKSGKDGGKEVVIKEIDSNRGLLNVYPNPTDGQVTMNFNVEDGEKVEVKVLDLKGNTIFENTYKEAGSYSEEINLEDQPKGIYMFNLSKKGYTESKKIVVD